MLSPLTDTLSQSTQVATGINSQGGVVYTTSNSSIQVSIAPAEDRPSQDPGGVERDTNTVVTPGIFITQTVGYTTPNGRGGVYASANSKFSGNFTGTGNLTNFNVMGLTPNSYRAGQILNLTVTNLSTHSTVLTLFMNATPRGPAYFVVPTADSNGSGYLPSAIPLDFSTVPGDRYNLSFDLRSNTLPGPFYDVTGTTSFVANTPEPATILLLVTGLGIVLFGVMRYRIGKDIRII
ncbi:MAG: PEP-CTERM sorting domain-containing protein [Leptospirales bacterium]